MNTPDANRLKKLAGIIPLYEDINPYEDADIYTRIQEIVNEWEEEEGHEPGTGPVEFSKMRSGSDTVELHTKNFDEIPGELYDMLLDDRGLRIHEEWHNSMAVTYQITSRDKPRQFEDVNPYEDSDEFWWYEDEGYGIDLDGVMEAIKHAASKIVGDTAKNRNSYFNVWYDVLDEQIENASQNVDDYENDEEVFNATRNEIEYYTNPENWEDAKDAIVYKLEDMVGIHANEKTLENFQKMGAIIHAALMTNTKPSLNEDVNPYEEADLSEFDEFLENYARICVKYFPAVERELGGMSLADYMFKYLKHDAKNSEVEEPKEIFDTFSEEDILKRIKELVGED